MTVVRMLSEKMNSRALTTSMNCFDSLIRDLELYDPPLSNAKFTWSNLRVSHICCRLDIFLFLGGWVETFPCYRQTILMTSDHFSVILDASKAKWGLSPFRCERMCGSNITVLNRQSYLGGTIQMFRVVRV